MDENEFASPAHVAALALHEMFTTLVEAGFDEKQALFLVAEMLKNSNA